MLSTLMVVILAAGAPAAGAAEWRVEAMPDETRIQFVFGATLHKVQGTARLASAELTFDPETGAACGSFVIDAKSLETGSVSRDRDMHRKVLESETFPEITFLAKRIEGEIPPAGPFDAVLHGQMEIHGRAHPLSLAVSGSVDGERLTATTAFVVPYVEWGMRDPSKLFLRVQKEVEVEVELVGRVIGPVDLEPSSGELE